MTTLSSLPTEIICSIAQYLAYWDICFYNQGIYAFRLTCRMLHSKSRYQFYRIAFSTFDLDCHPTTLECFLNLCNCDDFRRSVRRIVFVHPGEELGGLSLEEQVNTTLRDILQDGFRNLRNMTEIVIVTPFVARFLQHQSSTPAFQNLATSQTSQNETESQSNVLESQEYRIEQYTLFASQLFSILMETISATNIQLQKLEITREAIPSNRIYLTAFSIPLHALSKWQISLTCLKQLWLVLDTGGAKRITSPSTQSTENTSQSDTLCRVLENMPMLTTLWLQFVRPPQWALDERGYNTQSIYSLSSLKLPCLTHLSLINARTEATPLIKFLLNHKDTLESLTLRRIMLLRGKWRWVFESLLENHTHVLMDLELSGLNADFESVRVPSYSSVKMFSGRGVVVLGNCLKFMGS